MADSTTGSIKVKFGADTVEFDASVKGVNKALTQLKKQYNNINKELKLDPDNVDLLKAKLENLDQQASVSEKKIKELKNAQAALGEEKVGTAEWNKLQLEIDKTQTNLSQVNSSIASTSKHLSDVGNGKSVYNLNKQLQDTQKDLDILNQKLKLDPKNTDLLSQKMKLLSSQSAIANQKVEALKSDLNSLKSSDPGSSNIKTLERNLGEAEVQATQLKQEINQVGDESEEAGKKSGSLKDSIIGGAAAGAAAAGIQAAGSALKDLGGEAISANDSLAKFESTMGFAGYDDKTIAKAKADVKSYADDTVYDLGDISNTTAQLAANGIKDFTGLTQAAGNLNAIAGGNADTFKSVGSVLVQTTAAGKLTTENWNQISDAIPGASGKIQEALKKNKAYTGDFRTAMEDGKISSEEFNKVIMQLGNKPVAVEAAKSTKTFEGAIGNMQATVVTGINNMIDQIGSEKITGAITKLGELVADVFKKMGKAIEDGIKFYKKYADIINAVAVAVGIVVGMLTAYQTALKITAAVQTALNAVMNANPFILILTALTALVTAFVYFFTQTKTGQKIWASLVKNLKKIWQGFTTWIMGALKSIGAFFTSIWNSIKSVTEKVFNGIKSFFTAIWNGIKAIFTVVVTAIKTYLFLQFGLIPALFVKVFTAVKNTVSTGWTAIKTFFTNGIKGIVSAVTGIAGKIAGFFKGIPGAIKGAIGSLASIGSSIVSSVVNGITGVAGKIGAKFKGLANAIKSKIGSLASVGKEIIKKIVDGMTGIGDAILKKIKSGISSAKKGLGKTWSKIFGKGLSADGTVNWKNGALSSPTGRVSLPMMMKSLGGIVVPQTVTGGSATNINISVEANSNDSLAIAKTIEKILVRQTW
jgi:tape measure domain-containing protein